MQGKIDRNLKLFCKTDRMDYKASEELRFLQMVKKLNVKTFSMYKKSQALKH